MNSPDISKKSAPTAAELCRRAALGAQATGLLRSAHTPRQFLDELIAKECFADGVRFWAQAMPKPEAVWWLCLCARQSGAADGSPAAAAVAAAEKWVASGSDEDRRSAKLASTAAGVGTPAGCAALAAFLSGGSLAPPNLPAVPPDEFLTARTVAGGLILAAVMREPEKAPQTFRKFLALGVEIANGGRKWK
jgi:hypothetical protein